MSGRGGEGGREVAGGATNARETACATSALYHLLQPSSLPHAFPVKASKTLPAIESYP
jgi:hypothetical protein